MQNQSLSIIQDQRQVQLLAPQLRQSLEMLQTPILELRTLIQNEIQQNPTLEEIVPETTPVDIEPGGGEIDDAKELNFDKEFEVLARIDDEWRDYFMQQQEYEASDSESEKRRNLFFDSHTQEETLENHLVRQLRMSDLNEHDIQIGELIIGNINEDGYLTQAAETLAESASLDLTHVHDVISIIQQFDPIGVGARDLRECLLIQLERISDEDSLSATIVRDHLDALGAGRYDEIAKAIGVSTEDVRKAANIISALEPKPGRPFGVETTAYILPEVIVEKRRFEYIVILNDDQIPHLRISKHYRQLMKDAKTTPDAKEYIKDKIKAGMFLIKSIEQRKRTLRKVAEQIVDAQSAFLDSGISSLKPLTMGDIARKVGVHETTVCRCIANKYMKTPRGVFEMKYFFTPGIKTSDGVNLSNKTVQDMIASMVAEEDVADPLSDQEITERLCAKGISIARRTIAKYRIALNIPSSHLRK